MTEKFGPRAMSALLMIDRRPDCSCHVLTLNAGTSALPAQHKDPPQALYRSQTCCCYLQCPKVQGLLRIH
jgi:hypothetical protein